MKMKETITIDEFDGKKFKIRFIEEEDNRKAVLTHYLHNYHNGVKKHYEKEALNYLDQIVAYKNATENSNIVSDVALQQLLFEVENVPFPTPKEYTFKFIDLFAGIGGFRLALQNLGGKCVFTSEWDEYAKKTYRANFGETPFGDITREFTKSYIPDDFQVLCAGFPCQPFSHAGLKKGFEDTRGTLFFDVADIINRRIENNNPIDVIFLENVKGLRNHDKGNTLKVIIKTLNNLGYEVNHEILNSKNFGIPQNRERIFIVAWLKEKKKKFKFPLGIDIDDKIIYDKENLNNIKQTKVGDILLKNPDSKYTISDRLYAGHLRRRKEHKEKGNGFGFSSFDKNSLYTSTISARYYKDGSEILIEQKDANPRKLTPREAANLQGYPNNFVIPVSDNQAYKQFGNSVSVPVIQTVFNEIKRQLL
ncbi:DNA (cytosine-5-)-methyltransferase [Flavobacterium columnare]|nr:DNA (cytosine-5-)-methyltransferase [Flavobacterium columnare]MBF6656244.1 DNA (cytosine-5-)-methyltransferase [Flavobacterium columnare]MBF6658938.1 DNA (cytosine-5-)-methyltransferase [Flavobacterium columnare]PTD14940.1 DNA (cytosine-5-)-methyltransferase [Flavobacterium columnare]